MPATSAVEMWLVQLIGSEATRTPRSRGPEPLFHAAPEADDELVGELVGSVDIDKFRIAVALETLGPAELHRLREVMHPFDSGHRPELEGLEQTQYLQRRSALPRPGAG